MSALARRVSSLAAKYAASDEIRGHDNAKTFYRHVITFRTRSVAAVALFRRRGREFAARFARCDFTVLDSFESVIRYRANVERSERGRTKHSSGATSARKKMSTSVYFLVIESVRHENARRRASTCSPHRSRRGLHTGDTKQTRQTLYA